jgi:hypothetical protein
MLKSILASTQKMPKNFYERLAEIRKESETADEQQKKILEAEQKGITETMDSIRDLMEKEHYTFNHKPSSGFNSNLMNKAKTEAIDYLISIIFKIGLKNGV